MGPQRGEHLHGTGEAVFRTGSLHQQRRDSVDRPGIQRAGLSCAGANPAERVDYSNWLPGLANSMVGFRIDESDSYEHINLGMPVN